MIGPAGRRWAARRVPRWRSIDSRLSVATTAPTSAAKIAYSTAPLRPGWRQFTRRTPSSPSARVEDLHRGIEVAGGRVATVGGGRNRVTQSHAAFDRLDARRRRQRQWRGHHRLALLVDRRDHDLEVVAVDANVQRRRLAAPHHVGEQLLGRPQRQHGAGCGHVLGHVGLQLDDRADLFTRRLQLDAERLDAAPPSSRRRRRCATSETLSGPGATLKRQVRSLRDRSSVHNTSGSMPARSLASRADSSACVGALLRGRRGGVGGLGGGFRRGRFGGLVFGFARLPRRRAVERRRRQCAARPPASGQPAVRPRLRRRRRPTPRGPRPSPRT